MSENDLGFVISAGLIILVTIGFAMAMNIAFKVKTFKLAEALGLRAGVYQHKRTGRMVEVKSVKGNLLFVVDDTGAYNIDCKTFDEHYDYVGDL